MIAACAGTTPPDWAVADLEGVAATMQAASQHASAIDRAVVDAVECVLLAPRVGEDFDAVVIDHHPHGIVVQLTAPAVVATVEGEAELGERVRVRVTAADPVARRIELQLVR